MKDWTVRVRLDADERRMLEELAKHFALTPSSLVRMLLKMKFDEIQKESES